MFVSHKDHYIKFAEETTPGSVLIVVSDWLLLQDLLKGDEHVVHLDACLCEEVINDAARQDLLEQANEWMYDGTGQDLTAFKGVSIGRLFNRETSLALLSIFQIAKASKWVCETYKPTSVVLYDIRTEFGLIPGQIKIDILSSAATDLNARFINRFDDPGQASLAFPYTQDFTHRPHKFSTPGTGSWIRENLRSIYASGIAFLFRSNWIMNHRQERILLLPTGLMLENLLAHFDPASNISPLLIAEREKKNLGFLKKLWAKNVSLCTLPKVRLNAHNKNQLLGIVEAVKKNWATLSVSALQRYLRQYVQSKILDDYELLKHSARAICSIDKLLNTAKPKRIVVSDYMNPGTQEYIDLAYLKGIPVDYLPHGARVSAVRHEPLTGSKRIPAKISRSLIWGGQMSHYAEDYGIADKVVRIGYPALDNLDTGETLKQKSLGEKKKNALILPYSSDTEGYVNMSSLIFWNLVETVRVVHRQGYENIHVKIHPGEKFNSSYYRKVLDLSGVDVKMIHQPSGLIPHLEWADIVVGPIVSSSIVETLAYGRPFYAMLLQPSVNRPGYLKQVPLYANAGELEQALIDETPINREEILQYLASRSDIKNASQAFWKAMVRV